MYMESQVALECDGLFTPGNPSIKDGDSVVISSSTGLVNSQQPGLVNSQQPAKKQTRQWAAWTRQEEESFFNALRQVGKNFEKITCRVQSKNKDQVRHYYYRLVRRMNKLLGPGFSLDAKNSKDTNAAMLRWWSLLEKYSCKASKLHLKPRRFKIFIEALEHQLLKDRKKTLRKRPSQGENCSSASPANVSLHSKASGHDTHPVKLLIVDGQNIQKVGSGKGSSLKRNVNSGTNRSSSKGELAAVKTVRQRRKTGGASSAAYKKWEKAAMAGVSLVADAAEHLERTTTNEKVSSDQGRLSELFSRTVVPTAEQKGVDTFGSVLPLTTSSQQQITETGVHSSTKLKLQLFPIDEATRRALEKDEHNPHLELTLSARKKISSVIEHLDRKWGHSSIAAGELMLFPYSVQRENLVGNHRWTQETVASAADVYAIIGSPPIFRLRYGWFPNAELVSVTPRAPATSPHCHQESMSVNVWNRKEQNADATPMPALDNVHDSEQLVVSSEELTSMTEHTDLIPYTDLPEDVSRYIELDHKNNFSEPSEHEADLSWLRKEAGDGIFKKQWEDVDNLRTNNGTTLSAGDWADSLTNISMGELLMEASQAMDTDVVEPPVVGNSHFLQQIPFSCDSFDAAIAAHISGHQGKLDLPSAQVSHAPSIWDAEETCDAFSFRKAPALDQKIPCPSGSAASLETWDQAKHTGSMGFRGLVEVLPVIQTTDHPVCEGDPIDNSKSDTNGLDDSAKDLGGITDIYWPDSLGPLDLDTPSTRYHGQDLIFGDSISLSGLNRLIANSLDAFQNCSFLSLDKKEPSSTTSEARGNSMSLDHKIGGEV